MHNIGIVKVERFTLSVSEIWSFYDYNGGMCIFNVTPRGH